MFLSQYKQETSALCDVTALIRALTVSRSPAPHLRSLPQAAHVSNGFHVSPPPQIIKGCESRDATDHSTLQLRPVHSLGNSAIGFCLSVVYTFCAWQWKALCLLLAKNFSSQERVYLAVP
jgi:hypothetical protein